MFSSLDSDHPSGSVVRSGQGSSHGFSGSAGWAMRVGSVVGAGNGTTVTAGYGTVNSCVLPISGSCVGDGSVEQGPTPATVNGAAAAWSRHSTPPPITRAPTATTASCLRTDPPKPTETQTHER